MISAFHCISASRKIKLLSETLYYLMATLYISNRLFSLSLGYTILNTQPQKRRNSDDRPYWNRKAH